MTKTEQILNLINELIKEAVKENDEKWEIYCKCNELPHETKNAKCEPAHDKYNFIARIHEFAKCSCDRESLSFLTKISPLQARTKDANGQEVMNLFQLEEKINEMILVINCLMSLFSKKE